MRKIFLFLSFLILGCDSSDPELERKRLNDKRSLQIKLGMSVDNVEEIMGRPADQYSFIDSKLGPAVSYRYDSDNTDFMQIEIAFDSLGKVVRIYNDFDNPSKHR